MNKEIIKKAVIVAVIITVFSIIITGWIDYKKHKDYEAMKGDMIQSANKPSKDTSLVRLDIVEESITNSGVTMIITDHNEIMSVKKDLEEIPKEFSGIFSD